MDAWESGRNPMRYISTRGHSAPRSFEEVLLAGLADDGGLFLPETWPQIGANEIASFANSPYADVALQILVRFAGDSFSPAELKVDIDAAYAPFDAQTIAPLVADRLRISICSSCSTGRRSPSRTSRCR